MEKQTSEYEEIARKTAIALETLSKVDKILQDWNKGEYDIDHQDLEDSEVLEALTEVVESGKPL